MQVIYHLGAHCSDNDLIIRCLTHNAEALAEEGIIVPAPKRYRSVISDTMLQLRHQEVTTEIQDAMMNAVLDEHHANRLILSNEAFLGVPGQVIEKGIFYPFIGDKITRMNRLFGGHDVEYHIGLSNPAVFIPDVFAKAKEADLTAFLAESDPVQMRWSEMVSRLRAAAPKAKITVWANEDTPLMWPQVLQAISGHGPDIGLAGLEDFYAELMSPGGFKRMTGYLASHPPKDAAHLKRVTAAFLDKFALDDVIETEIDLPGWTDTYVETITNLYDQDLDVIAGMDGVTFLTP